MPCSLRVTNSWHSSATSTSRLRLSRSAWGRSNRARTCLTKSIFKNVATNHRSVWGRWSMAKPRIRPFSTSFRSKVESCQKTPAISGLAECRRSAVQGGPQLIEQNLETKVTDVIHETMARRNHLCGLEEGTVRLRSNSKSSRRLRFWAPRPRAILWNRMEQFACPLVRVWDKLTFCHSLHYSPCLRHVCASFALFRERPILDS
jgi:hypothetical protein